MSYDVFGMCSLPTFVSFFGFRVRGIKKESGVNPELYLQL